MFDIIIIIIIITLSKIQNWKVLDNILTISDHAMISMFYNHPLNRVMARETIDEQLFKQHIANSRHHTEIDTHSFSLRLGHIYICN